MPEYQGDDPDGFMSPYEVVAYRERHVELFKLPVRYCIQVTEVEQNSRCQSHLVTTDRGTTACARHAGIATGLYREPKIPPGANHEELSAAMDGHILEPAELMDTYIRKAEQAA